MADPIIPDFDEKEQRARELQVMQGATYGRNPDESAETLRYARDRGVGFEQAERERKAGGLTGTLRAVPSWQTIVAEHPTLAQSLTDPGKAAVMQDDLPQLSWMERIFGGWDEIAWNTKERFRIGKLNAELADIGWRQISLEATPEDMKRAKEIEEELNKPLNLPYQGYLSGVPATTAESLPMMGKTMWRSKEEAGIGFGVGFAAGAAKGALVGGAVTAPAGGEGAAPGALVGGLSEGMFGLQVGLNIGMAKETGKQEAGLAFREYMQMPGVTEEGARTAATAVGIVNGSLELIPLEKVFKIIPGATRMFTNAPVKDVIRRIITRPTGKAALARLGLRLAEGAVFEGITEFLQEGSTIIGGVAAGGPAPTIEEGLKRAWDAGVAGSQGGLGFSAFHSVADFRADLKEAAKAQDRAAFFKSLGDVANASTLLKRMPEEYKAYANALINEYGQVDEAKAPAGKLRELFQKEGISDAEVAKNMPEVARQLAEAGENDEIVIPMADLATHIAPLKNFATIHEDLRIAEEPTAREAKEIRDQVSKMLEADKAQAEKVAKDGVPPLPGEKVFNDIRRKAINAGMSERAAGTYAAIWRAFSESRGQRTGKDAFTYYSERNVTINQADVLIDRFGVRELAQEVLTPADMALYDAARTGNVEAFNKLLEKYSIDPLTGANRQEEWNRFAPQDDFGKFIDAPQGVYLAIDANDLKRVNDTLGGHNAGNAFLRAVARIVGGSARANRGKFFRSGGDEFMVHFKSTADARAAVQAITEAMNGEGPLKLPGGEHRMSVSMGLAAHPEAADAASMEAKKGARAAGRSGFGRPGAVETPDYTQGNVFMHFDEKSLAEFEEALKAGAIKELRQDAEPAPVFFSAVEKAAQAAKQEKGTAASWMAVISKTPGVKKEELEWMGLDEWLNAQGSKVITRQEVLGFIRANMVEIDEQVLGVPGKNKEKLTSQLEDFGIKVRFDSDGSPEYSFEGDREGYTELDDPADIANYFHTNEGLATGDTQRLKSYMKSLQDPDSGLSEEERQERIDEINRITDGRVDVEDLGDDARFNFRGEEFETVTLHDGGEIVDFLRDSGAYSRAKIRALEDAMRQLEDTESDTQYEDYTLGGHEEGSYREILFYAPGEGPESKGIQYEAPHYGEQGKGLLAHARLSHHEVGGKRVLMIEEIQSDRHQKGRDVGYDTYADVLKRLEVKLDKKENGYTIVEITDPVTGKKTSKDGIPANAVDRSVEQMKKNAARMFFDAMVQAEEKVPDAPFKTTWEEFVVKRLIRWAAENGFDQIAWTTGEMQADRYNLAKQVDEIKWYKPGKDAPYRIAAFKDGRTVIEKNNLSEQELAGLLGRDMAEKITAGVQADEQAGTLSGLDLQVGGEGMKAAYDQRIPRIFEKMVKKYGGKVTQDHVTDLQKATTTLKSGDPIATAKDLKPLVEKVYTEMQAKKDLYDAWTDQDYNREQAKKWMREVHQYSAEIKGSKIDEQNLESHLARLMADPKAADKGGIDWALGNYTGYVPEAVAADPFTPESRAAGWEKYRESARAEQKKALEKANDYERRVKMAEDFAANVLKLRTDKGAAEDLIGYSSDKFEKIKKADFYLNRVINSGTEGNNPHSGLRAAMGVPTSDSGWTDLRLQDFAALIGFDDFEKFKDFKARFFETTTDPGPKAWTVGIPEELRSKVMNEGQPLFQKTGAAEADYRGKINFDATRRWFNITLSGKANLSTFLHESGHAFLEFLRADAEGGHEQSVNDLRIIREWLGAEDGEITDGQLEKFARGFEAYLREGKAPSSKLAEVFRTVSEWLRFIYRTLAGLNVELTDEVRGVMDRLLATDEEIAAAQARLGLAPVDPKDAFAEKFNAAMAEARDEAARAAMRETQRTLSDEYEQIKAHVRETVKIDRAYNAWEVLAGRGRLDGGQVEMPDELRGKKLSRAAVQEMGLGTQVNRKLRAVTDETGVDPETIAPYLGFESGDVLVASLAKLEGRARFEKAEADRRMAAKYPGYSGADVRSWIRGEAKKALHTDRVGDILWAEAQAVARKVGKENPNSARAVLKAYARAKVASMTALEMQPGRFERAEALAAKEWAEAYRAGDFLAAHDAKRRQLQNHYLWRETMKALEETDKIRRNLQSVQEAPAQRRLGLAGPSYREAVNTLLEGIEFTKQSNKALGRRESLELYLRTMEDDGAVVTIPQEIRAGLGLKNYRQMTLEELRAINDSVENIVAQARLKNKIFDGRKARAFNATTTKLAEHIRANVGAEYGDRAGRTQNPEWWERKKEFFRTSRANLTKIEFLCRVLDGGKTAGWAHELIFQPFRDAQNRKMDMLEKINRELTDPFRKLSMKDRLRLEQHVDFLGWKLRGREVLSLILNLGNEGNRTKLLEGYAYRGWTEERVMKALNDLKAQGKITDGDLDIVEHFWKTIDSLWPEIKALNERVTGVAPPRVQAMPFEIGGRKLAGGYFPIVYDREKSHKGEQIAQRKTGDLFENNFMLPAVEKGFTESRTKFHAPILLSLDVIPQHVNEVIHYLTHYEAVRAVDRITSSKVVREALTEGIGKQAYESIRPWLQAIAADGAVHEGVDFVDRTLRRLRLGSSIALLGFKVTTGLKQIFGLSTSAKELGIYYTGAGIGKFMERLANGEPFKEIAELSGEFRHLDMQHDRDMAQMFERYMGAFSEFGHAKAQLAHFALAWMMLNQKVVNAITWYGAREKALAEGHEDPVRYADAVVAMTQSGGGIKDTAAIQRGTETKRMFVVMYTYFSVMANQLMEPMPKKSAGKKAAQMAARWWWLVTLPVLLDLGGKTAPDDGEDTDDWAARLAREQLLYAGRTVPLYGTALEALLSEREARYGAWYTTMLKGLGAAGRTGREGEATEGAVKSMVDLVGAAGGLPSGAFWNAYRYTHEFSNMEEPVQNFLFRSPSDWE